MTAPFWPDVGEAGRCFGENARPTWAVASNSEIDFSIYKTQNSVGERGDPIDDERAIWRVSPTHRRQLIAGESVAWATSLPVKRSGPSSDIASSDLIDLAENYVEKSVTNDP